MMVWLTPLLWSCIAIGLFALFASGGALYDRAGWRLPAGAEDANMARRLRAGVALGAAASVICALCAARQADQPARLVALVAQGALMAAAGLSDLYQYRLPLPMTLGGIALALGSALILPTPPGWLLLGFVWSCALVLGHVLATRGRMGWGDHLAVLWIGLAAPVVGLLAILIGHVLTLLVGRFSGWGRRPVPIGGAWLLACASVFALPLTGFEARVIPANTLVVAQGAPAQPQHAPDPLQAARRRIRHDVLREAGFLTAQIGFESRRAAREAAARSAAGRIEELAQLSAAAAADNAALREAELLRELARALRNYDVPAIGRLSGERAALAAALAPDEDAALVARVDPATP